MVSGLSPSSIDLWLQCQRRFREEKIQRRASPSGPEASLGTFVHLVLEHLMQEAPANRTAERVKTLARECWDLWTTEDERGKEESAAIDDPLAFRRSAWGSIRRYLDMETPQHVEVVGTEQKMEVVVRGVPLRGTVDRLDRDAFDDLVIVDYKNGKVPPPMFRDAKWRQLNLYAAMVEEVTQELAVEGRLVFTAHGEILRTSIDRDSADSAIEVAVKVWDEVNQAYATGKAEAFEPDPGPLCGWCPFAAECPEGIAELKTRRAKGKLRVDAPAYYLTEPDPVPG